MYCNETEDIFARLRRAFDYCEMTTIESCRSQLNAMMTCRPHTNQSNLYVVISLTLQSRLQSGADSESSPQGRSERCTLHTGKLLTRWTRFVPSGGLAENMFIAPGGTSGVHSILAHRHVADTPASSTTISTPVKAVTLKIYAPRGRHDIHITDDHTHISPRLL